MITRISVISAFAALCCAGPVLAAGDSPAPRSESANNESKVVCQVQRVIGSRLARKRICLTREQWREQERMQRQDLNIAQRLNPGRG